MELLIQGSLKQIKEAASKGLLTWKGRKVILDPFLALDLIIDVEGEKGGPFSLTPLVVIGSREEKLDQWELLSSLGALQAGVFRFWKENDALAIVRNISPLITAQQLEKLMKEGWPLRFKKELPSLKPAPLPILRLVDRTGAFANLAFDYGEWRETDLQSRTLSLEEQYWENDLLETGFKKKMMESSHYFCPLDQVGASLTFLIDIGWKVIDYRGKQVIRQHAINCQTEEKPDALLLRGTVRFGEQEIALQDVMGVFERRERWIDLSPHHVGLIEMPSSWSSIIDEERSSEGIRVRKAHIGLLSELVSLPPSYVPTEWKEALPSADFRGTLFPYQQKGVDWLSFLYRAGFCGLLADEMGLGKTVQVLAFLTECTGPILIVMPVTLLSLWKQQFEQFLPGKAVYVHQGTSRSSALEGHPIILTSYATLRSDRHLFMQMTFDTVILDEAQVIKNSTTQIAHTVYQLKSRFRLALTGTPIENRQEEIVSIFRFLMPMLLEDGMISERSRKKIKPFILRRTKQEVDLDLPEKIIQAVGVDPSEEEFTLYEQLLQTKRTRLLEQIAAEGLTAHRMEVLELILRLRQHCCHPRLLDPTYTGESRKFSQVLTDLEEVIASQNKVLVYSQFTSMLKLFEEEFKVRGWNYVYLDGSTRDRQTPVEQFQNDPAISIFLISLRAGGVGLNLQAADYVFLYDPWWNSAVEMQAIDRAHRVGRKKTVIARKYFTTQSIEAKILDLQSKKEALAQTLWEDQEVLKSFSFDQVVALLGF